MPGKKKIDKETASLSRRNFLTGSAATMAVDRP